MWAPHSSEIKVQCQNVSKENWDRETNTGWENSTGKVAKMEDASTNWGCQNVWQATSCEGYQERRCQNPQVSWPHISNFVRHLDFLPDHPVCDLLLWLLLNPDKSVLWFRAFFTTALRPLAPLTPQKPVTLHLSFIGCFSPMKGKLFDEWGFLCYFHPGL